MMEKIPEDADLISGRDPAKQTRHLPEPTFQLAPPPGVATGSPFSIDAVAHVTFALALVRTRAIGVGA
jgi:hypothetical protein